METSTRLGDYLRARRQLVQPGDVGLQAGLGRRRVPGLRREEVAQLAGVSADYYLRLEQGRDLHPSEQVLDALARALLLDEVARRYLHELARATTAPPRILPTEELHKRTRWLVDSWVFTPAVVHNRYVDVLASNRMARAINPNLVPGNNSVLTLLVDPYERALYREWEGLTARSVALLRTMTGASAEDGRMKDLITQLLDRSERFRELWDRNDVVQITEGTHIMDHPDAGELVLHFARLPLPGTDGHTIFVYHAEPGTTTEAALKRLAGPL